MIIKTKHLFNRLISRKYYKSRLWKITFWETSGRVGLKRISKVYERRDRIGAPFDFVRGTGFEIKA